MCYKCGVISPSKQNNHGWNSEHAAKSTECEVSDREDMDDDILIQWPH